MFRPPVRCAAAAALFLGLIPSATAQGVVYVDADASGSDDGSSWADAFTDLQGALATSALEVWVAEGVYVPGASGDATASFQLNAGQALLGGFAGTESSAGERDWVAHVTTLSGDLDQDDPAPPVVNGTNSEHVVTAQNVDTSAVLDGFVVRRGHVSFDSGAGMKVVQASPTVRNCTFERNGVGFAHAGAVLLWDSAATFEGCTFQYNYVHAGSGGAVYDHGTSAPTFVDCTFRWNECTNSTPEATGGGLEHRASGLLSVIRCRFESNTARPFYPLGDAASLGGGIHLLFGELYVQDCVFQDNFANSGGGIYTWQGGAIVNTLFVENEVQSYEVAPGISHGDVGGGLMVNGPSQRTTLIANCTFVRNTGGEGVGIFAGGQHLALVRNSILWENESTGQQVPVSKAQVSGNDDIAYSCVQGLLTPEPGEDPPDPDDYPGSHEDDPAFADLPSLDLHLTSGSPCVDAGDNAEVPAGIALDLDGAPRLADDPSTPDTGAGGPPTVDMGVFEHGGGPCPGPTYYCIAGANSVGPGAQIALQGSLSVAANGLALAVSGAPPNQNGLFFYGHGQAQMAFGDGYRCVASGLVRLPVIQVGPSGSVLHPVDLDALPNPNGQITPGSTWSFQFWYRDPAAGGSGFNLSDAFEATFCP